MQIRENSEPVKLSRAERRAAAAAASEAAAALLLLQQLLLLLLLLRRRRHLAVIVRVCALRTGPRCGGGGSVATPLPHCRGALGGRDH